MFYQCRYESRQFNWFIVTVFVLPPTRSVTTLHAVQNDGYWVFLLHLCTSMGDPMIPSHTHSGFDHEYRCQCMQLDLLTVTCVLFTIFGRWAISHLNILILCNFTAIVHLHGWSLHPMRKLFLAWTTLDVVAGTLPNMKWLSAIQNLPAFYEWGWSQPKKPGIQHSIYWCTSMCDPTTPQHLFPAWFEC